MTISDYACEGCGYEYRGCGGLGVLESGWARQTVSCADCQALHDVKIGVNLWNPAGPQKKRKRRAAAEKPTIEAILASLAFACPVDPSHAARPWTDGEPGWTVPGAIVSLCPICEGHVRAVRTVMLVD